MERHLTLDELEQWNENKLDAAQRDETEHHLAACAVCRARSRQYQRMDRALHALPHQQPPPDLVDSHRHPYRTGTGTARTLALHRAGNTRLIPGGTMVLYRTGHCVAGEWRSGFLDVADLLLRSVFSRFGEHSAGIDRVHSPDRNASHGLCSVDRRSLCPAVS
jgi:hypothetical protein